MPRSPDTLTSSDNFGRVEIKRAAKINAATARELAQEIVSNHVPVGTPLPTEKELAERFGIGRGTMREALRLLETFGLIEMRTGRYGGPVVRSPDARDLSVSLTLAFYANGSSMLDVLEARLLMEPALAEIAAERIAPATLAQLRETIAAMRADDSSEQEYLESAERFHNIVAKAAASPVLSHLTAGLQHIAGGELVGISYSKKARLVTADSHEAIAGALERKDGKAAREFWRSHLSDTGEYWKRRFPDSARRSVEWNIGIDSELSM